MFSLSVVDALPGFLQGRAVHELRAPAGTDAHTGFAMLLLSALAGAAPILWVSTAPLWYPPGLAWAGLDPARCLFAQARDDTESLSTLETALRGGMAGAAECRTLPRLAAKRLAMAARQGGGIGLVLRHAPARTSEDSTAFATRWLISPAPGTPEFSGLRAELLYAKGGRPRLFFFALGEEKRPLFEKSGAKTSSILGLRR
jgi:protein ImuA